MHDAADDSAIDRSLDAPDIRRQVRFDALLDLLDVPHTTNNARRLAQTMRGLGWIGLKSRRLMPGGFRDTTIRGWARPHRDIQIRKTSTPECPAYDRGE
jgi:hypothetical protein